MTRSQIINFARINFRNDNRLFGIKDEDRLLHVYVIGKTGTGKSTLIEKMALQDLERGNGFALIDPHGDLVSRVAGRIPASPPQEALGFCLAPLGSFDCVAGHIGLELRNVVANYRFEKPHRFPESSRFELRRRGHAARA
jgi:hypothetical protein